MGFSAYGVTQGDDPVALAMKGLIDNASGNAHQIAMLWAAIEKLSSIKDDCVPNDAQKTETFDAESLTQLMK
jgi:serine O-acetyltransferase